MNIDKLRFRCRNRDKHENKNYNEYHLNELVKEYLSHDVWNGEEYEDVGGHTDYCCPECNCVIICCIEEQI